MTPREGDGPPVRGMSAHGFQYSYIDPSVAARHSREPLPPYTPHDVKPLESLGYTVTMREGVGVLTKKEGGEDHPAILEEDMYRNPVFFQKLRNQFIDDTNMMLALSIHGPMWVWLCGRRVWLCGWWVWLCEVVGVVM